MTAPHIVLAAALLGCAPSGPTFVNVESVVVQQIRRDGLTKRDISSKKKLRDVANCLYTTTEVTEEDSRKRNLLQTTFLIDIKDVHGIRSFELFTDQHLKGNKGNYYFNKCLHTLISTP
jgi:hypothetical protein